MNPTSVRALKLALLATMLAGCSASPPVHYYTLLAPDVTRGQAAPTRQNATPPFLLEILPVTVPPQADQPQIMMRERDGALTAYYSDRWAAPLADEIRGALSYHLVRRLGVPDVQSLNASATAPVWRVQVDVQRFDAAAGAAAVLDATWRIRPANLKGGTLLCRSVVQIPLGGMAPAQAVAAQQQATADLAATIASGIESGGARAEAAGQAVQLNGCTRS
jgi:uncharacterized lipoprotein YmbA